jgi:hypothetical protein
MYISHKYKMIFVRTPRAAGSSICKFLIDNIDDPEAIYTPVEDDNMLGTVSEELLDKHRPYDFYGLGLEDLINEGLVTKEQVEDYTCFCILRDPIERQKSLYYQLKYMRTPQEDPSLTEYKAWTNNGYSMNHPNDTITQYDRLRVNGKIMGQYWLYEYIDYHLKDLFEDKGIRQLSGMPRFKLRYRRDKDFDFDLGTVNKIRKHFKEDFNLYSRLRISAYETDISHYTATQ